MFFQYLVRKAERVFGLVDRLLCRKGGSWLAAFLCSFFVLLSSTPEYKSYIPVILDQRDVYEQGQVFGIDSFPSNYTVVRRQIENPLFVMPDMKGAHPEKKQFRLTMPAIAHFLHLDLAGLFILYQLMGIVLFWVIIRLVQSFSGDSVLAFLTAAGAAFIYPGKACFVDLHPWFDGAAYLFLLLAMLSRRPFLIFLFAFAAAWTDERAVIASCGVFLWWLIRDRQSDGLNVRDIFLPNRRSLAVFLAVSGYIGLRMFLHANYGLTTRMSWVLDENAAFKMTHHHFPFAVFSSLEMYWLLPIGAALLIRHKRQYILLTLLAACFLASVAGAVLVADITKSIGYLFPACILCLFILFQSESQAGEEGKKNIRLMMLLIVLLCLLIPSFKINGPIGYMLKPFYYRFYYLLQ